MGLEAPLRPQLTVEYYVRRYHTYAFFECLEGPHGNWVNALLTYCTKTPNLPAPADATATNWHMRELIKNLRFREDEATMYEVDKVDEINDERSDDEEDSLIDFYANYNDELNTIVDDFLEDIVDDNPAWE